MNETIRQIRDRKSVRVYEDRPIEADVKAAVIDAAQSLGLGSCYIGDIVENFEFHRELLKLPRHVVPAAMVCFGYPTDQQLRRQKPTRFKAEDLVHENGYDLDKSNALPWMVMERQVLSDDEVPFWLKNLCRRKWDSEFSREMTRSAQAIADDWCGK